jgi:hypothetical protein
MTIAWAIVVVAILYSLDKHNLLQKSLFAAVALAAVLAVGYGSWLGYRFLGAEWERHKEERHELAQRSECVNTTTGKAHPVNERGQWCGAGEQIRTLDAPPPSDEFIPNPNYRPQSSTDSTSPSPSIARWAEANFLGFSGGELADEALKHAGALGLERNGDCKSRLSGNKVAMEYTDCEFTGREGESMELSFYYGELERVSYRFGIDRYNEIRNQITTAYGPPRSHGGVSEVWGSFNERFSISMVKTEDGASGYATIVLDPPASK